MKFSEKDERIRLLKLGINRGKGGAIKRGVQAALGKRILMVPFLALKFSHYVQVDADGATDIRDLDNLWIGLNKIERSNNHEIVGVAIGSRFILLSA